MENRYTNLFRVILILNCLVLFLSFTGVRSAPVALTMSIIDVMKNDSKICSTSNFLYDSKYTKPCGSIEYPTDPWKYFNSSTLNNFLCLGVYDTAYKICQYSNQSHPFPFNNTATFDSHVEKYLNKKKQEDVCTSLQGFTLLYNKIESLWKSLVESLKIPHICGKICFDFHDTFQPLCAVLALIKNIDDNMIKNVKEVKTKHDLVTSDKPHVSQSKDEVMDNIKTTSVESKKTETKEIKEQEREQIVDSNSKKGNANVPDDVPFTYIKSNEEKTKFATEKENTQNNNQKKINNTSETQAHKSASAIFKENKEYNIDTELDTNAEVPKPIKNISPNSNSQAPSVNKAINNINKNVEENAQKSNKEQNVDELKPSTLSENTQDHYDAPNPEENMENDIDDVDDTIQHPDTGNQNENVQEIIEQKNNGRLTEYSTMGTEDDSHFFTYFTVITLACLAGYIGYHNKQKIFAIVLEGRRSRSNRGRRRPSTASYRKLDCTLEEAVTSQCNANVTHVIY